MRFVEKHSSDGVLLGMHLQKGVFVRFEAGETVTGFILRVLCISEHAMKSEIQTLILNNGCVDSPDSRLLESGDTLVLSGAMPGLVGAMLRSGSPIKAMRETLSSTVNRQGPSVFGSMIRLKLFNSVLSDYKHTILNTGFYLPEDEL